MSGLGVTTGLESSFDQIHKQCNRARLLVVGKTGVGKTSLIKAVFKVESLSASHGKRGESDINAEITSNTNPYFVIHDSKGYEPADTTIYNELVAFINDRVTRTELSEKIHMVWMCIATPCAGARVLEYGTEQIIKLCVENNLPFLVVFTKYDELEGECFMAILDSESMPCENPEDEAEIERVAAKDAIKERKNLCADFVRRYPKVRYEYVSTYEGHEATLSKLVKLTEEVQRSKQSGLIPSGSTAQEAPIHQTEHSVSPDIPRLLTSIAQRTSDPEPKIAASIEVGSKRYWKSLASSADFPGHSLKDCLDVLHVDIAKVWNFVDPSEFLLSTRLKAALSKMCGLTQKSSWERFGKEISFATGLAGVAGAASGPLAAITAPAVFGGVLFAAWVVETYRAIPEHARCLVAYILNFLGILQRIPQTTEPLTLEALDKAISEWGPHTAKLQGDIDEFLKSGKYKHVMKKDPIIEMIGTLAKKYMVK